MVTAAAISLIGVYFALAALLYSFQGRLIHLPDTPGRQLEATPAAIGADWEDVQLTARDGVKLHGWYLPASAADAPTLLFFHGNAGNISHRLDTLAIFRRLGVATLIIDYRGYGRSEGQPTEAGLYLDADAAWQHLAHERHIPPERIVAFGRSLGGAIAAHLAAERPVGGLIVESAFTSIPDLGREQYPLFPVRTLARFQYPTREYIARTTAPVLVIHSPDDEIIPYHHGQSLYQAANEPKQFLAIQGGHNTGYLDSDAIYRQGLADFLASID